MNQYENLLRHVSESGLEKSDRTGTGTKSVFGYQMRFDLTKGFPLVTTKRVHLRSVIAELLWMLSGSTNGFDLQAVGCSIWDEWMDPRSGDLGPIYGAQWRSWPREVKSFGNEAGHVAVIHDTIDQIANVIESIRTNPDGRRHVVSAWNVADIPDMALPPCHALFQFYVAPTTGPGGRGRLSCQLYQRSADIFLGVPFNISSYALLTHMVAAQCDLDVGDFIWTGGDCHIYSNHSEQVALQLSRAPLPYPALNIKRRPDSIFDYKPDDFEVIGYECHPAIKAPVAV